MLERLRRFLDELFALFAMWHAQAARGEMFVRNLRVAGFILAFVAVLALVIPPYAWVIRWWAGYWEFGVEN
jgi:hypothetical protein